MKLIITADIHNGVPGKINDTIWAMNIINEYAKENEIRQVMVLGDLFHDRSSINIDVLNAVYDFFGKVDEEGDVIWSCFPGNHDMYLKNSWKIHSIHVLNHIISITEDIKEFTFQGTKQKFWILPFIHFENNYMQKLEEINKKASEDDILLTHIGVLGATLNECFLLKNWSQVTFENTKFKRVFTGHFHCHQEIGKTVYPGSPIPFRFDEGMSDHGFLVYDIETNTWEFIKIFDIYKKYSNYRPPDYMTIIDKDLMKNVGWFAHNHIKIVLSKDYTANEMEKIRGFALKYKALSVGFKMEKKKIEESKITYREQKIGTPRALFEAYIKKDEPKLNTKILLSIHSVIEKDAEERIMVEEAEDVQA
jgi:hypothetical protein